LIQKNAEGTIDAKSRVSMPTRFRSCFEEDANLVLWFPFGEKFPYLILADETVFRKIKKREYARAPQEKRSEVNRLFNAYSESVALDKNARFVIPPAFMERSKLECEKKAFYVGQDTHLEIWALDVWKEREQAFMAGIFSGQSMCPINFAPEPSDLEEDEEGEI
jgi:division/cell wall cluster transcriptional repressor MraZ